MTDNETPQPQSKTKTVVKKVVKGKSKTVGLALWNRFKDKNNWEKIKLLIQSTVATAAVGGLAVGGIALASAQEVQDQVNRIDPNTVITIPTPPDLTKEVQKAQETADGAQGTANNAQTDADKAEADAAEARRLAELAASSTPRLASFGDVTVRVSDPEKLAGTYDLPAGTYLAHFGAVFPDGLGNLSTVKLVIDGKEIKLGPFTSGYKEVRAILTSGATTVELRVDAHSGTSEEVTYSDIFAIFTKLQ